MINVFKKIGRLHLNKKELNLSSLFSSSYELSCPQAVHYLKPLNYQPVILFTLIKRECCAVIESAIDKENVWFEYDWNSSFKLYLILICDR